MSEPKGRGWPIAIFVVVVVIAALIFSTGVWQGYNIERVVKEATPRVVANATKEVVTKTVPEVSEKVYKDTVPAVVAEAINQTVPEVVKQTVPLAVPLVVDKAVPLVEARAKVECCPDKVSKATPTPSADAMLAAEKRSRELLAAERVKEKAITDSIEAANAAIQAAEKIATRAAEIASGEEDARVMGFENQTRVVEGEFILKPLCGGGMGPKLLPRGVKIWRDEKFVVHIDGIVPIDVEVYSQNLKPKHLRSVVQFQGERGTRFNFPFRCEKGHEHFALITPEMESSKLKVLRPAFFGQGIGQDCSHCCGCAFIVQ